MSNFRGWAGTGSRYEYDAFGSLRKGSLKKNPYGFTGKRFDAESGLYHFQFRKYDPSTGVWTSPDPIDIVGGLNLYGYVSNNPIILVDLVGQWATSVIGLVSGGIGGFLSGMQSGHIWEGVVGGVVGAGVGLVVGTINPIAAGAAGGAAGSMVTAILSGESAQDVAMDTALGAAGGLIVGGAGTAMKSLSIRGVGELSKRGLGKTAVALAETSVERSTGLAVGLATGAIAGKCL